MVLVVVRVVFFFQAEDGIRDADVTGVQTCALPISTTHAPVSVAMSIKPSAVIDIATLTGACVVALGFVRSGLFAKIGRASCRERCGARGWPYQCKAKEEV